jgi:hypothetical protein
MLRGSAGLGRRLRTAWLKLRAKWAVPVPPEDRMERDHRGRPPVGDLSPGRLGGYSSTMQAASLVVGDR